jgi:hypothetical protein
MKISTLLMIMVALQFTLMLFGEDWSNTPLILMVTNPFDWASLGFIGFFGYLAGGVITTAVIVGTLVFGKNDLVVFSGAVAVFAGCCFPIVSLWMVIYKEIGYFGEDCTISTLTNPAICSSAIIASIFTAPLLILSVITIVNWWRGASDIN